MDSEKKYHKPINKALISSFLMTFLSANLRPSFLEALTPAIRASSCLRCLLLLRRLSLLCLAVRPVSSSSLRSSSEGM